METVSTYFANYDVVNGHGVLWEALGRGWLGEGGWVHKRAPVGPVMILCSDFDEINTAGIKTSTNDDNSNNNNNNNIKKKHPTKATLTTATKTSSVTKNITTNET